MKSKSLFHYLTLFFFLVSPSVFAHSRNNSRSGTKTTQPLLLLRYPTMSKTQLAFEYGGEIWIANRKGGDAHRIVTGMDVLTKPIFSPDGSMIAYTGTYDHNTDVYVVSARGSEPKRLTFHPGPDVAVGWNQRRKERLVPIPPLQLFRSGSTLYGFHYRWIPKRITFIDGRNRFLFS